MEYENLENPGSSVIPVVSICVVTYNHSKFIKQCLDSILMQKTDFAFEIIVGEDESTDGTRQICYQYAKKHPDQIRLFLRSRKDVIYVDGHPTGRYNFTETLKAARGTFVAFCEGDDYWSDPFKLQKQVDFLEANPDCIACHHWQRVAVKDTLGNYIEMEAPKAGHGYFPETKSSIRQIFTNQMRVKLRTLMFRSVITTFPRWFYKVAYGDVPLSMILGKYGNFGFIDEPMAVYRKTDKGLSAINRNRSSFYFDHYLHWIAIWELGDIFYSGRFKAEATKTIHQFYESIWHWYSYRPTIVAKTILYACLRSNYPSEMRLAIAIRLTRKYIGVIARFIHSRIGSLFGNQLRKSSQHQK